MTITITRRSRIVFDDPNVGRRVGPKLKSRGFRWSGKHGVWYSKKPGARDAASAILGVRADAGTGEAQGDTETGGFGKSARRRHPLLGILGGRP